jgi:hypothetical protein
MISASMREWNKQSIGEFLTNEVAFCGHRPHHGSRDFAQHFRCFRAFLYDSITPRRHSIRPGRSRKCRAFPHHHVSFSRGDSGNMQHLSKIDATREHRKLITFEAQSRVDRAWQTVGIFDDRPTAVSEAERILEGRRTPAVRVIQVLYDPASSECTEYTVFRATCFDEENHRSRRRVFDQEMFEWGADGRSRDEETRHYWFERYWPHWAPDWATTALMLSLAVLAVSILFRWVR